MKARQFLLLGAGAAALFSCNADMLVEYSQSAKRANTISFTSCVTGTTRSANAAGPKVFFESGDVLHVHAGYADGSTYFLDEFVKGSGYFTSERGFGWPDLSAGPLTFTAFWNATQPQAGLLQGYAPDAEAGSQKDILVARHQSVEPEEVVMLNFRHILSQVSVKVKNSNPTFNVIISGARIGYLKTASEQFLYSGGVTDHTDAETVSQGDWTLVDFLQQGDNQTMANLYKYDQDVSLTLTGVHDVTALEGFQPWIILPQDMKRFEENDGNRLYEHRTLNGITDASGRALPDLSGTYIALKMRIEYMYEGKVVAPLADQWCYWPIDRLANWNPGWCYSYIIDVATGGYHGDDQNDDGVLDPVLKHIVFDPDCTIDQWDQTDDMEISGNLP